MLVCVLSRDSKHPKKLKLPVPAEITNLFNDKSTYCNPNLWHVHLNCSLLYLPLCLCLFIFHCIILSKNQLFMYLCITESDEKNDNSALHQGRVRGFAHVEGNWPSHVFIDGKTIYIYHNNNNILTIHTYSYILWSLINICIWPILYINLLFLSLVFSF